MIVEYFPKDFPSRGDFSKKELLCFGKKWVLLFSGAGLFRIFCPEEEKGLALDRFLEKRGIAYAEMPCGDEFFSLVYENMVQELTEICLVGTQLQRGVWKELLRLSWGETISYSELAKRAGYPRAVRAVASAVGDNPLPLLVPCHRVIRANGEVGEFRYGTPLKKELLVFEEVFERGLDKRLIVF